MESIEWKEELRKMFPLVSLGDLLETTNFILEIEQKAREEGYKKGYIDGQIEKINKPKTVVSEFDKTSYLT